MIFIAGPRQSGKTTLLRHFLAEKKCNDLFFNWDTPKVRNEFRKDPTFFESTARLKRKNEKDIWVGFDEIHKRTKWKDILKGYYDQFSHEFRFVITGSARLDLFRRSGDSLIGRYFLFNLLPFSFSELAGRKYENLAPWHEIIRNENWPNTESDHDK